MELEPLDQVAIDVARAVITEKARLSASVDGRQFLLRPSAPHIDMYVVTLTLYMSWIKMNNSTG
ncbi:hypothetical protein RLO149_c016760 [Roseobacter litoralis Och 149]|uniref:Uncharacterized protein n=1 Tax=Roseobacter litoralis (strain ATCC 49566 / DSM 6996 / JCM 21268 / NBRC 15278 / OCh 149) TaxID=391595 RepID=F7ZHQ8_ROSLO|nr:hypothetical protein RLO149_c016760 [Roseobacter litoralis Och 149]